MTALAASLVAVPTAFAHRPAGDDAVTAAQLRDQIGASVASYSGYVETQGTLPVPDARGFSDVTALFAGRSRLRVWWGSSTRWRVDRLTETGEQDLVKYGPSLVRWEYDGLEATYFPDPDIRLPRTADLVPPALARQALSGIADSELRRLSSRRVAGRHALGLRVTPDTPLSTVGHVDLWSDRETGLPLRVELYTKGATAPAFTSEFREVDLTPPDPEELSFTPPPGVDVRRGDVLDLADGANRFAPYQFPDRLIGLPHGRGRQRGVGVYRLGPTWLIAMPMLERVAEPLKDQLRVTPGSAEDDQGVFADLGPLSVLVTSRDGFDAHTLIAGTVTREALRKAATVLADGGYVTSQGGSR